MSTHESAAPHRLLPSLSGLYDQLAPLSYPLMRFCIGAMLVPHGYAKLFQTGVGNLTGIIDKMGLQPATGWAYWIAILEFFGGIMLALGLLTRPVALLVAVEMAVAALGIHWGNGFFWTNKGYEYPLLWGLLCLAIAFRGGDKLSLDGVIGKEI
ncbi:MAG TPA: DoxX family protein [Stellaceae bacterium]|nr:DoxX family protein [Stellaceae bacterium]